MSVDDTHDTISPTLPPTLKRNIIKTHYSVSIEAASTHEYLSKFVETNRCLCGDTST